MKNAARAQSSTEYLVIFAVVLIITMIVVYILNNSSAISGQASQAASQSYWSSLNPLAIMDSSQTGTSMAKIAIQNTGARELVLNRVVLITDDKLYSYTNNTATVFLPGQKRVMNIHLDTNVVDCANYGGKAPNRFSVFIAYDDDLITGKVFNSTNKLLALICTS